MRRIAMVALGCFMLLAGGISGQAEELTAAQIMERVTDGDNLGFNNGEARVKLSIRNKRGQERVRTVNSKSIEKDGNRWTLVTFLEPADVAGTRLLSKEVKGGSDLQYLYLPALKEKRRIAGSDKNESFMGTDFTYNDLEQTNMEDATHTRLEDTQHSGIDCYLIETTPTDKGADYSKLKVWVDKQDYLPLKVHFFDKQGVHVKTLIAKMVEPLDGKLTITMLMMKNVKKGSKTTMEVEALDRSKVFPEAIFDENKLDK
jgi:hypothetical protein